MAHINNTTEDGIEKPLTRLYRFTGLPNKLPWNLNEIEILKPENWKARELDSLLSNQIQLTTPVSYFNDMFEVAPLYTANQIKKWTMRVRDQHLPSKISSNLIDGFSSNEALESLKETRLNVFKLTQMICFSGDFASPALWGHYANGGKGLCFEILPDQCSPLIRNKTDMVVNFAFQRGIFGKVKYTTKRPSIDLAEYLPMGVFQYRWEFISSHFLTKHKDWRFENEYRVIFHDPNASLKVGISRVLLGPLFDPAIKADLQARFPGINFCNTRLSADSYKVEAVSDGESDGNQ